MHSDDSTNGEFDTPTTAPENETHDDSFAAELRDLELRLEQLELEQRSLRIQIQRARLRRVEHNTGTPPSPTTTRSRPQQPSVRGPLTPGRTPSHLGACDERSSSTLPATPLPDRLTSQGIPQQEPLEDCTPRAGDRLDAAGHVLRVGDEVSFLATQYTAGGTAIIRRFTATFAILRRSNGGEVRRAPSNVTRLLPPHR